MNKIIFTYSSLINDQSPSLSQKKLFYFWNLYLGEGLNSSRILKT